MVETRSSKKGKVIHNDIINVQLDEPPAPSPSPSVDRLTDLPDTVLVEILSLIPIITAVSTSILSTRWRYLWTQLINICLDWSHFPQHTADFYPVVDLLLTRLTSPCLQTFSLHVPYPRQQYFERWLRVLCTRNVQNIDIAFNAPFYLQPGGSAPPFTMPLSIFRTESLKCLILPRNCLKYELPNNTDDTYNLPNLIKLELSFRASHCGFVAKLVRSCPLLTDLSLNASYPWNNGNNDDSSPIDISSKNLERLELTLYTVSSNTKVVIDAPKLNRFHVSANRLADCSLVRKPLALHEVTINLFSSSVLSSLLPMISNVRVLRIYAETFGMLETFRGGKAYPNSLSFHNLTKLCLRIENDTLINFPFESTSSSPLLRTKMIRVSFSNFNRVCYFTRVAEFLLRNASALERLTFHHYASTIPPNYLVKNKLEEMSFCIDLYPCSRNYPKCVIKFWGQHAKLPTNDKELTEMENHVGLLRKLLSLQNTVEAF